ncbi:MAG: LamG-like jellyroll fold domain-containing protein, partial [archaeon]
MKNKLIIFISILLVLTGLIYFVSFLGFTFIEPNLIEFDINNSWNLSDGFTRISQFGNVYDSSITLVIDKIVVNLSEYNLTEGIVYVDLIINETIVDSEIVNYLVEEEIIEFPITNETINGIIEIPTLNETINKKIVEIQGAFVVFDSDVQIVQQVLTPNIERIGILEIENNNIKTDILALEVQGNVSGIVYLPKIGDVNIIKKCDTWNFSSNICNSEWYEYTEIFEQNDSYIWFTVDSFSAYSGWYNPVSDSSEDLQVDYVQIDKKTPYKNDTLTCENGSISDDVSKLLYFWYVNDTLVVNNNRTENRSTLTGGNFSQGDQVDCAVIPQNGTSLLAYYPFDEGKGSYVSEIANNYSLDKLDSVWNWSSISGGKNHYQLCFNGSQYAQTFDANPSIQPAEAMFINFKLYPSNASANGNFLIWENTDVAYRLQLEQGVLRFGVRRNNHDTIEYLNTPDLTINTGDYLTASIILNSSSASIYINGTLVNDTYFGDTQNINYTNAGRLYIGGYPGAPVTSNYVGCIDELSIWNAATMDISLDEMQNTEGFVTYSTDYFEIETNEGQFGNGTLSQTNITWQSGNISILNETASTYYHTGNFTSQILRILNNPTDVNFSFKNLTPTGTELYFKIRSGEMYDNESKDMIWTEWHGPDYTHFDDSYLLLALDFSTFNGTQNVYKDFSDNSNEFIPSRNNNVYNRDLYRQTYGKFGGTINSKTFNLDYDFNRNKLNLTGYNNFTIEMWINKEGSCSNQPVNLFRHIGQYNLSLSNACYFTFDVNLSVDGINSTVIRANSSNNLTTDWNHLIITYNNISLDGYLNGEQVFSEVANGSLTRFAGDNNPNLKLVSTLIDSLLIYNRSMDSDEIAKHANDSFVISSGEPMGDLNSYVQYKAFLKSDSGNELTPIVDSISLGFTNYSTYIYNKEPYAVTIVYPTNGSSLTTDSLNFNWTGTDLEEDTIFYEFVLSDSSTFTNEIVVRTFVNNFTDNNLSYDKYTIWLEHADYLPNVPYVENDISILYPGRFGNGFYEGSACCSEDTKFSYPYEVIPENEGTIEFWGTIAPTGGDIGTLFNYKDRTLWADRDTNNNILIFSVNGTNVTAPWDWGGEVHFAFTWKENNSIAIIINGTQLNSTPIGTIDFDLAGNSLQFFSNADDISYDSEGTIDELRISNISRLPIENLIISNYTANTSSLSGTYYWKVRAVNSNNKDLDDEVIFSPWSQTQVVILNSNNLPNVDSIIINSTSTANYSNGSIQTSWVFSDSDGELQLDNETKWVINNVYNI